MSSEQQDSLAPYLLIVDNDEISCNLFAAIFARSNYEIRFCHSAEEAFAEVQQRLPDLVISEIVLPDFNGFELRKRIHLIKNDLALIFVSAVLDSAGSRLLENLSNDVNTFFLRKPIFKDSLLNLVQIILQGVFERKKTQRYFDQLQSDLALASQMQRLMLPDWITLEAPDFFLTANYMPYSHLSGDYFDLLPLKNGRYFFVIGDISGHGVKAALHMSVVQSLTKIFSRSLDNDNLICDYLNNMNRQICSNFPGVFHLTCLAAVIDSHSRTLDYMSAGHPGFWIHQEGEKNLKYMPPLDKNIPVGWMGDYQYSASEISHCVIPDNSFFVALTDGVIERANETNELLGLDGFSALSDFNDDFGGLLPFFIDDALKKRGYTKVHDDMLVTAFGFFPKEDSVLYEVTRVIPQSMRQGSLFTRFVQEKVSEVLGDKSLAAKAELVTGEFLNNIIIHALDGKMSLTPQIFLRLKIRAESLDLLFIDRGKEWNYVPTRRGFDELSDDDFYSLSQAGRGMRIIEEIVDNITRYRVGPLNVTRFLLSIENNKEHTE